MTSQSTELAPDVPHRPGEPSAATVAREHPGSPPAQAPGLPDLVGAVAELARMATEPFTTPDLLRRLVDCASTHLPVEGAGVMVADDAGLAFLHGSRPEVQRVGQLQDAMQQGPCLDALQSLREVVVPDVRDPRPERWQDYLTDAEQAGLRSLVAVPLVSRGRCWGVLDLYRHEAGPWSEHDVAAARLLADVAASYVVMAADRDQARQAQHELARRSLHDELTGLPNRTLLFDRLSHALTPAARHGHTVAVLFLDLDRFKQLNDTFGHAAADRVLVEATRRVAGTLRAEDTFARLSGDEFVVVCEQLPQHTDDELDRHLLAVVERITAALAAPVLLDGVELSVSASIGVALSDRRSTPDDLLSDADAAMCRAKQRRDAALAAHDHPDTLSGRTRRHLDRELTQALAAGELRVHYQPIVDGDDRHVHAVEALLRWQHPQHGLLAAADFIEIADSTGLIVPIGHWMLDAVCAQQRAWCDLLGARAPETAYVNLSARQLNHPDLQEHIDAALRQHGLEPQQLGFDLLETSLIDPHLVPRLRRLHQQGHPLSLDDFGTGCSSLSRLLQVPVDHVKIDRSFVAVVDHDPRSRSLVAAILLVARSLNMTVIAEGVETVEQARRLTVIGCPLLQGNHVGPPRAADDLTLRLSEAPDLPATAAAELPEPSPAPGPDSTDDALDLQRLAVHQATGMIMAALDLEPAQALEVLRATASERGTAAPALALDIVERRVPAECGRT